MGAPVPVSQTLPIPLELEYLKNYWLQCRRDKLITYQELFYFQQTLSVVLFPWEIEIIIQIDNIYWS